jgi:hypothetical protein
MQTFRTYIAKFKSESFSGLSQPKKFSEQSEKHKSKSLKALKNAIEILSGDEPEKMLQELLSLPKYQPGAIVKANTENRECLDNICREFIRATNRDDKIFLLSLVANIYPSKFLKDIGFCFGSALFAQARKYPR